MADRGQRRLLSMTRQYSHCTNDSGHQLQLPTLGNLLNPMQTADIMHLARCPLFLLQNATQRERKISS